MVRYFTVFTLFLIAFSKTLYAKRCSIFFNVGFEPHRLNHAYLDVKLIPEDRKTLLKEVKKDKTGFIKAMTKELES